MPPAKLTILKNSIFFIVSSYRIGGIMKQTDELNFFRGLLHGLILSLLLWIGIFAGLYFVVT